MEAVTTALTTAFTTMQNDVMGIITAALPIAIGIVAVFFAVKKGISFFKQIANKG